jgi:gliding motility-associated-like protein
VIGCYAVLAVDKAGNRSRMSDTACITVDTCGRYRLPNVFSPNDDGFNDYFVPFPFVGVERIDLQVFNRWGKLVFKTSDPDINWDGKIMGTNQPASDGVYYYICDVYEVAGEGTVKRTLKGSITIIR